MNKLWKKIICFVLPVVMVAIVCMAVVLPLANKSKTTKTTTDTTLLAREPIYYASAEDTGASTASSSEKGGAIYVGVDSTYTMKGGTISGKSKKYGGAVYVSNGATFTMEGGTITSCTARYGGAIYVASGATCNITGGTITGNSATYAPAIYVEDGGILNIEGDTIIENNVYAFYLAISKDTAMVGGTMTSDSYSNTSDLYLHYTEFGSYPQTYVGDDMNTTLESWYGNSSPSVVNTYNTRVTGSYGSWSGYMYTDGNIYARGISYVHSDSSYKTYADGTTAKETGSVVWFKVEPIRWFILNYDEYLAGTDTELELFSELALAGLLRFYPNTTDEDCNAWYNSEVRTWLNTTFMQSAFTEEEQNIIALTEVKNNVTGDYINSTSDGTGTTTYDNIYLKSAYEMNSGLFNGDTTTGRYGLKLCSPTDFAVSNYVFVGSQSTPYRVGTVRYWTRSAGSKTSTAISVCTDSFIDSRPISDSSYALRPVIRVMV